MNKLKRRLFFWTLVILFFVIAPAVILYARGYRFDSHRGVFVYGGAITLKTNPETVDIGLDGKAAESKQLNRINNSQNITGLLPADYEIRVSAPGFRAWNKKTDVHSGLSSEFWNVLLVRESYDKNDYADTRDIDRFFVSPRNRYVVFNTISGDSMEVKIFDVNDEKTNQTFSFAGWKLMAKEKGENIEWSPQEDYLSVPTEKTVTAAKKGKKIAADSTAAIEYSYFIIESDSGNYFNLNEFLNKKEISDVRWDPKEKDYLFFLSENNLYRADIKNASSAVSIAENVSSFDLSKSDVYYIRKPNNFIFKMSLDGQSEKEQITSNFPGDMESNVEKLIIYDEMRSALIDQNKNLYVYNEGDKETYFKKLGSDIEGVHFSNDGKKLLFWNSNEIFVYFVRDWEVQPVRYEDTMTGVTRYSEPIGNVQWFKDYEHVVFNTGKWVKIIELDDRDHRNCLDIISTEITDPSIRFNNELEYLYFTDKVRGASMLRSIVFPEPTPILGIGG